jgi:hypothetical protein
MIVESAGLLALFAARLIVVAVKGRSKRKSYYY